MPARLAAPSAVNSRARATVRHGRRQSHAAAGGPSESSPVQAAAQNGGTGGRRGLPRACCEPRIKGARGLRLSKVGRRRSRKGRAHAQQRRLLRQYDASNDSSGLRRSACRLVAGLPGEEFWRIAGRSTPATPANPATSSHCCWIDASAAWSGQRPQTAAPAATSPAPAAAAAAAAVSMHISIDSESGLRRILN